MKKRLLIYACVLIALVAASGYWLVSRPLPELGEVKRPAITAQQTPPPSTPLPFNKQLYSLTDPTSPWLVVNKLRPLQPKEYVPGDLVVPSIAKRDGGMRLTKATATAMEAMFADAAKAGNPLKLSSAYRSYAYQLNLYNGYVASQGQASADAQSARPGYSEHQTGMAADIAPASGGCNIQGCFAQTPAGQWVAANAYKYGFIIRYPDGLTAITGYMYEPWHVRYVGVELATEMHNTGTATMEEFFGLPAAPTY